MRVSCARGATDGTFDGHLERLGGGAGAEIGRADMLLRLLLLGSAKMCAGALGALPRNTLPCRPPFWKLWWPPRTTDTRAQLLCKPGRGLALQDGIFLTPAASGSLLDAADGQSAPGRWAAASGFNFAGVMPGTWGRQVGRAPASHRPFWPVQSRSRRRRKGQRAPSLAAVQPPRSGDDGASGGRRRCCQARWQHPQRGDQPRGPQADAAAGGAGPNRPGGGVPGAGRGALARGSSGAGSALGRRSSAAGTAVPLYSLTAGRRAAGTP